MTWPPWRLIIDTINPGLGLESCLGCNISSAKESILGDYPRLSLITGISGIAVHLKYSPGWQFFNVNATILAAQRARNARMVNG